MAYNPNYNPNAGGYNPHAGNYGAYGGIESGAPQFQPSYQPAPPQNAPYDQPQNQSYQYANTPQYNTPIGGEPIPYQGSTDPNNPRYDGMSDEAKSNLKDCHGEIICPNMEESIRRSFIKKTLGLFGVQMLSTTLMISLFTLVEPLRTAIRGAYGISIGCGILSIAILIPLLCCGLARKYPINLILLTVFNLSYSLVVAQLCAMYTVQSVFACFAGTAGMVLILAGFAIFTKFDMTKFWWVLVGASLGLCLAGLFAALAGGFSKASYTIYLVLGTALACAFIVFRLQMIFGGKHRKYAFGVDDSVLAALCLYLDVIDLFIHLLRLFGKRE